MRLTRRQFLANLSTTIAVSSFASPTLAAPTSIKPARLREGDRVGLISPASATFLREELDIVVDAMRALGLIPQLAPHLFDRYGYLAGHDADRAADVNRFFSDPAIAAIIPIQGGWGCSRILPYLDYKMIRRHPKILVGFSDLTALILAIYARTNLVTFHGPNGLTSWRSLQTESFRNVLFAAQAVTYQNQKDSDDADRLMQVKNRIQTINPGQTRGKLIGGNLTILSTLVGTPYLPDLQGAILFVEDVGESIYRIDRLLTHLKLAGVFNRLAGFIFGQCIRCPPDSDYGSLTLEEVVWDCIKPLKIPAWYNAQIGHLENMLTLPIGIEVEIDANSGTIQMLEPAAI